MRILLVEDEPRAAAMLAKGLREEAYVVDVVGDGGRAAYQAAITDYDAIILDILLPVQDGLTVCRTIRQEGSTVPVLMLTARDEVQARIEGLDSGADDYLTKPFDLGELLARLRALIRRGQRPIRPTTLHVGPLRLDTKARRVMRDAVPLDLTAREYALLEHLALHVDEVVGRASIAEHVWDSSHDLMSNAIDVCVQRLRKKIDGIGQRSLIITRRGEGYMLTANESNLPT
jgi:DNA-binding response OmpR family regulator